MKPEDYVPRGYQTIVGCLILAFVAVFVFLMSALILLLAGVPSWLVVIGPFFITPFTVWWLEKKVYASALKDFEKWKNDRR